MSHRAMLTLVLPGSWREKEIWSKREMIAKIKPMASSEKDFKVWMEDDAMQD